MRFFLRLMEGYIQVVLILGLALGYLIAINIILLMKSISIIFYKKRAYIISKYNYTGQFNYFSLIACYGRFICIEHCFGFIREIFSNIVFLTYVLVEFVELITRTIPCFNVFFGKFFIAPVGWNK